MWSIIRLRGPVMAELSVDSASMRGQEASRCGVCRAGQGAAWLVFLIQRQQSVLPFRKWI